MNLFITGIGTNVGKTIVSAVLTEYYQADYWKPIQSGVIEGRDADTVELLISNTKSKIHPETYLLNEPLSPHFAAKLDNVSIEIDKIHLPKTNNNLIIEGAGGILVPLNSNCYVIDIAKKFNIEIVLVVSNYLGCINHTLLSIDYLKKNNFKIHSIIFNGNFDNEIIDAICNYSTNELYVSIPQIDNLTKEEIKKAANYIKNQLVK